MKTWFALAAIPLASALSGHVLSGHDSHLSRRHHQRLAARARAPSPEPVQRKSRLVRRKIPGTGDSVSQPDNLADGSFTADQGCTCWHTVSDGEVCLGLIDKSTSAFTLDVFHKFNPQVNSDCSNLVVGSAYCVDNGENDVSATNTGLATQNNAVNAPKATPTPATSSDDDEEDCDDEEEEDGDDDDCEDEEDGSASDDDGEDCEEDEESSDDSSEETQPAAPTTTSTPHTWGNGGGKKKHPATSTSTTEVAAQEYKSPKSSPTATESSSGAQFTGVATWYTQNGNAGACGDYNPDTAYIVALYTDVYSGGAHCGSKVKLTNIKTGVSVTATVADMCPSCGGNGNIDTSVAVFGVLSNNNPGAGVEDVAWSIL